MVINILASIKTSKRNCGKDNTLITSPSFTYICNYIYIRLFIFSSDTQYLFMSMLIHAVKAKYLIILSLYELTEIIKTI
jgi:hypothetical protein